MTQITVTFVRKLPDWRGDARLYKLSEPVGYDRDCETGKYAGTTDHVAVSAADVMFSGPETYVFPADAEGEVLDWGAMDGSFRGALDHERAIREAEWVLA